MYRFSPRSSKNLNSANPDFSLLFNRVIKIIDCTVLSGYRTVEEQQKLFAKGRTEPGNIVTGLDGIIKKSKHQFGHAVDVVPYPIDWDNRERFVYFAGIVKGIASQMDIKIRWGGDWDNDNNLKDQKWMDLPHYELR